MASVYNKCKNFFIKRQEAFLLLEAIIALALFGIIISVIIQYISSVIMQVHYANHIQELLYRTQEAADAVKCGNNFRKVSSPTYEIQTIIHEHGYPIDKGQPIVYTHIVRVMGTSKLYKYTVTVPVIIS